jgi:hypothetical protein
MARAEDQASLLQDEYHSPTEYTPDSEQFEEKEYLPHPGTEPRRTRRRLVDYIFVIPTLLRIALFSFLHSLTPSFFRWSDPAAKAKLHPTAYLDGVRGVAAFIVLVYHGLSDWFPALRYGYGSGPEYFNFLQLPMVRIFYQGRGMVTIFFIVSGYALSYKALRQMRAAQYSALLDSLASSTFRRGMRLFIPTTFTTFISCLVAHRGWYRQDPLNHNLVIGRLGETYYDSLSVRPALWQPALDYSGRISGLLCGLSDTSMSGKSSQRNSHNTSMRSSDLHNVDVTLGYFFIPHGYTSCGLWICIRSSHGSRP